MSPRRDPQTLVGSREQPSTVGTNPGPVRGSAGLFLPDGHWRDLVAFSSHILTMNGTDVILGVPQGAIGASSLATLARPLPTWRGPTAFRT